MVGLRLISISLAALVCLTLVYLAVTQKFSAIADLFDDPAEAEVEAAFPPPRFPPSRRPDHQRDRQWR